MYFFQTTSLKPDPSKCSTAIAPQAEQVRVVANAGTSVRTNLCVQVYFFKC